MRSAKRAEEKGETERSDEIVSYFDINQLELAFINRALSGDKNIPPPVVEIGKNERILRIQKRNLESLCRGRGKEYRASLLEGELKKILSGVKVFSLFRR
ncbi:MAG TPA: hypothetical protein VLD37_03210 [Candidatus Bilamarchaeum sp.]|nr:hypothetical protein [Candidatus Bilamarchaeum sp.]